MLIERRSPLTGKVHTMDLDITHWQIAAWQSGTLIQDAFPHLTAGEREFFKSGITPAEWDAAFGIEDDEFFDDGDDTNFPPSAV